MKIFVCYTTRDGKLTEEKLKLIHEYLLKYGPVFIDLINNDSIKKQIRVVRELKSSNRVLVIETNKTYASEWVKFELEMAKSLGIDILRIKYKDLMKYIENDEPLDLKGA